MYGGVFLNLGQLLDELGYAQSSHYRSTGESSQEPLTEHLFRAATKAGAQGAYLFETSPQDQKILPSRPAVYVAEAKNRDEARKIHQRLWNLGNAPFIVILLPNEIRVYTGFDFSLRDESQGLVKEVQSVVDLTFSSIQDQLKDFRADSIDSGKIWETQARYVTPEKRVDTHLLNNLNKLEHYLKGQSLDLQIIHPLIGKYVYIRYLYDRGILSREWLVGNNIDLDTVLGRNATLVGLLHLIDALEHRFNGAVFPLPSDVEEILSNEIVSLVASTFKGDDPVSGQLHLDFEAYDFSYIPVETLSSIYEQFLNSQGTGKKVGAVYTPEPVADYLLCELQEANPLQSGMKILDPCCGSGIFLVLAYRRLIELELAKNTRKKLKPTELRKILTHSLYGVERNKEACYVAEFSLILTLLNYIDPPELHRNKQFKFPSLHNTQIFECDFFDNESSFWKQSKKFDWIVGNPPWIELKKNTQGEELARQWLLENINHHPVGGNRICEAFTWRVVDLLDNEDACVGLLVHATSLFNKESKKYRKSFFEKNTILRVTNFSHLAYTLFDGRGEEPAATLIYKKNTIEKPDIVHYAPFVVNQLVNRPWGKRKKQTVWTISIHENEISVISPKDAQSGELFVWKTALWGQWRDAKAIKRLDKIFPVTLGDLANQRDWYFDTGLQIRKQDSTGEIEAAPYLEGYRRININTRLSKNNSPRAKFRFTIPESLLHSIPPTSFFVRKGRSLPFRISRAPHIVLGPAYCAYSDVDFVIPEPQIGISAKEEDANYLRAISILINSSFIQYFLFFNSPSWGVGRNKIFPKALRKIPIPELSQKNIEDLSRLQKRLAHLEESSLTSSTELQKILDDYIQNLLLIPQNIGILSREFMSIRLQLNKGKAVVPATESPSEEELQKYGLSLRNELDSFTTGSNLQHKIRLIYSKQLIVCSVEFIHSKASESIDITVEHAQEDLSLFLESLQKKTKQQFSQWVYVQRSLRIFDSSKVYICKSPRLIDWTRTQALNDADDIIAEILSANRVLQEAVR